MPRPNAHHLCIRVLGGGVALVVMLTTASALARPRDERGNHGWKSPHEDGHDDDSPTNILPESAASGKVLVREQPGPPAFHGLAWHPGGQLLAAGGADSRIFLFDGDSGDRVDTLTGHDDVVTAVAWSPDGTTLASTAGGPLIMLALVEVSDGPDEAVRLWRWR